MLSLGAVAFDSDGAELDAMQLNLTELPGATQDPDTMEWWSKQPKEAWAANRSLPMNTGMAMGLFVGWLKSFDKPKFLCAPVGFDHTFVRCYLVHFCGSDRIWHNAIDFRSYCMGRFDSDYNDAPGMYSGDLKAKITEITGVTITAPHSHIAVEDAREQGQYFFALKNYKPAR
jgi:hypothetical protein